MEKIDFLSVSKRLEFSTPKPATRNPKPFFKRVVHARQTGHLKSMKMVPEPAERVTRLGIAPGDRGHPGLAALSSIRNPPEGGDHLPHEAIPIQSPNGELPMTNRNQVRISSDEWRFFKEVVHARPSAGTSRA